MCLKCLLESLLNEVTAVVLGSGSSGKYCACKPVVGLHTLPWIYMHARLITRYIAHVQHSPVHPSRVVYSIEACMYNERHQAAAPAILSQGALLPDHL